MNTSVRAGKGFSVSVVIGTLGGMIGLGGAEFRLPLLVSMFGLQTVGAVVMNKAMSLVVVSAALLFRTKTIPLEQIGLHADVVVNLLVGSLAGAWWAAGHAMTMSQKWLNRIILILLTGLAVVMLSEAVMGIHGTGIPLFHSRPILFAAGVIAGFGIGAVAALLGVAGGELLIPTIVLLFGLDIKLAGSLSLAVSLPTMIVSFFRYTQFDAMAFLRQEKTLFVWMAIGSVLGSALGGMLLGLVSTRVLMFILGAVLLVSSVKIFKHSH